MMSISIARSPKLAFFTLCRRRTTKNVSFTYMKLPHRMSLYLLRFWRDTLTDPYFCPLHTLSLISQRSMWSGLVDVVHRVIGRPRVAPRWPSLAGGMQTRPCVLVPDQCTSSLWPDRHGFTRVTSISPRITVTPYPTFVRMSWIVRILQSFNPSILSFNRPNELKWL